MAEKMILAGREEHDFHLKSFSTSTQMTVPICTIFCARNSKKTVMQYV